MTRFILILRRVLHYAAYLAGGVLIVLSVLALTLRFWVMPDVERYRADLEAAASAAVGMSVQIGAVQADWHGIHPRLILHRVQLDGAHGEALILPRVDAVGSWLTLLVLEPRLRELRLERPQLPLRRTRDGDLYLAGIALDAPGRPHPFPDWLLRQGRILVKDAQVSWLDEQLGAPRLTLSRVRLMVHNAFGRHRFGGLAYPSDGADRLELRGDLRGGSVHDRQSWSGVIYARVHQARLQRWPQWVPWAQAAVRGGQGELRLWLTLEQGRARELVGDARLAEVGLSMGRHLPELRFTHISGRLGWGKRADVHTLYVDRLHFDTPHGRHPGDLPARLRVHLTPDGQGGVRRVEVDAANLRLEAFTALSSALPLPGHGHELVDALAPQGLVESARGHWAGAQDYALNLRMRGGGMQPHAGLPGLSGMDVALEADHRQGRLQLASSGLGLDWPTLFRHPLGLTRLDASADWRVRPEGVAIRFQVPRLRNPELDGEARGEVLLPRQGTPVVDLHGRLARAQANAVYRYLPLTVSEDAYTWLRRGLQGGHAEDVRLRVQGDLRHFPFDRGGGQFLVRMRIQDGVLDYAPGWPRIEGIGGVLTFEKQGMHLQVERGRVLQARLGPVRAVIADLFHARDEIVQVDGHAQGELNTFLDIIRQSPVNAYTDRFTEGFRATGAGVLALRLNLPARRVEHTTVGGAFAFHDNTLLLGEAQPSLSQIRGSLSFTERSVQATGIELHVAGLPAQLDLVNQPGAGLRAHLRGSASAEQLATLLPAVPPGLLDGTTAWQAEVSLGGGGRAAGVVMRSDLAGMAVNLPAPLGKAGADRLPLEVRYLPAQADGEGKSRPGSRLYLRYGEHAGISAFLPATGQPAVNLHLGAGSAPPPGEAGLWVSGRLGYADLDAWRAQLRATAEPTPPVTLPLRQAVLGFDVLRLAGRRLHDLQVRITPAGAGWQVQAQGRELQGEVVTVPEPAGTRVLARFKRLTLPPPEPRPARAAAVEGLPDFQALDLHIHALAWQQRQLGELRMRLGPAAPGKPMYRLDHFQLTLPEGRLEARGQIAQSVLLATRLKVNLSSDDLGRLLARLGHADAVRGGEGSLSGTLGWLGGVQDFALAHLDGELTLAVRRGQFLRMDPGAGRLLGVLSLQALPRRITLDFRDVFSEGFAFDEINGQFQLERGQARTQDLRMHGPAARVRMHGGLHLGRETQDLHLNIQPRLDDTVAVAGALLGGPVVGLGTLLATRVLKDPLGQATSFEYRVTGSWAEPVITPLARPPARARDDEW